MLEQILLALQLTPDGFRTLAGVPSDLITTLPWPTQKDITRRKVKLRDAMDAVFLAADEAGTDDVEMLLASDSRLRSRVQLALWDGPVFAEAVRKLAALSAPRPDFTTEDLGSMSTKALRTLCAQHGVLPHGTVERVDLLKALVPFAVRPTASLEQPVDQAAVVEPSPFAATPT